VTAEPDLVPAVETSRWHEPHRLWWLWILVLSTIAWGAILLGVALLLA
jgi:hypothetical protein